MKTLFDDKLTLNDDGINLSASFSSLLKIWLVENNVENFNPIEVELIVNNEIQIEMANLYFNKAMNLSI